MKAFGAERPRRRTQPLFIRRPSTPRRPVRRRAGPLVASLAAAGRLAWTLDRPLGHPRPMRSLRRNLRTSGVVGLIGGCLAVGQGFAGAPAAAGYSGPGVVAKEFIFEQAPFRSCHASTIAETPAGLVAAWFGGTEEGSPDVGIWVSRKGPEGWSRPEEVAVGADAKGNREPCWNPVLFQVPGGPLLLFYKAGPSPREWRGLLKISADAGRTWSEARRLPPTILGPIKNKPILLPDGMLLCGSSTEHRGWRVHFEWTGDCGKTWGRTPPINDGKETAAIQPTLFRTGPNRIRALVRTRQKRIFSTDSADGGVRWSPLRATSLPNPNSGIDGVTLRDGRHLLVYNHTRRGRTPLQAAVSNDAVHWQAALILEDEPGEYSYPAVIQTGDGMVHVVYTWRRKRIRHAVLDPGRFVLKPIVEGRWPR